MRGTMDGSRISMANKFIFDELTALLRDVFDDDTLLATPQLTAHQVRGWDSLGHIRLILEIERVFRVRFSAAEISSLKNVGELAELIATKTRSA
jgi:acyl carrier protein